MGNGRPQSRNHSNMNLSVLPYLRCPAGCDAPLALADEVTARGEVVAGRLCCGGCGRAYPIQEGIPRLLPDTLVSADYADVRKEEQNQRASAKSADPDIEMARKRSEMRARDEQVEDYDRLWPLLLYGLIEIPATQLHLGLQPHHTMLEAGCGTGRMTRDFAARCGRLIAVDFSWESLRVNAGKLRRAGVGNVDLVQADICHLPLGSEQFDRVVCCGVIEHIPTAQSRGEAVREMGRVAKTGGNLVISGYQYSLLERLFGTKEGEHPGGIYFIRFTRDEFHALLSSALRVEAMSALIYYYVARCRKSGVSGEW